MPSVELKIYRLLFVRNNNVGKSCTCQARFIDFYLMNKSLNILKIKMCLNLTNKVRRTDAKDASNLNTKEVANIQCNQKFLIKLLSLGNALTVVPRYT